MSGIVPATSIRSDWRGEKRSASAPKRAMSKRGPTIDIISIAETIDDATTEIRAAPTRHLRATLELQRAGGASPTSFEARLVAAGVGSLPVDVWLDADDDGRVDADATLDVPVLKPNTKWL